MSISDIESGVPVHSPGDARAPFRPRRLHILGVPVDALNMTAAVNHVSQMLSGDRTHTVLAVNPEKVIAAQRNDALLRALQNCDLLVPDGIGVVMAARLRDMGPIERVPGSELMPEICRLAAGGGHGVFLFGARPDIVARTAVLLEQAHPGLRVVGTRDGYIGETDMDRLIDDINASGADVLFVALGSPRQELWIERYRARLRVKVCQGVGGTFDAICGYPRRAPLLFRKLNLEWFYRLVTQPSRAHRQLALPVFAARVLSEAVRRR